MTEVVSIVVPACNEEAAIGVLLDSLLAQDFEGRMEIAVCANGCQDATAARASEYVARFCGAGHRLVVLERRPAGKCGAINEAERELPASTRIYIDADVALSRNAVSVMHAALTTDVVQLVSPRIRPRRGRSWATRSFARAWSRTRLVRYGVVGAGVLGVSREGRSRWGSFPVLIADDGFIRVHFHPHERRVLESAHFTMNLPEGLRELIDVRARWRRGAVELQRMYPCPREHGSSQRDLLSQPAAWPDLPLYALVNVCARLLARSRQRQGVMRWERANRARHGMASPPPPA